MKKNSMVWFALLVAGVFLFAGSSVAAVKKGADKTEQWARQAEESFYLAPGMASRLLSKNQWNRYQDKMKGMPEDQLSSYRLQMHGMLMQEARDKQLEIPPVPADHGKRAKPAIGTPLGNDAARIYVAGTQMPVIFVPGPMSGAGIGPGFGTAASQSGTAGSNAKNTASNTFPPSAGR